MTITEKLRRFEEQAQKRTDKEKETGRKYCSFRPYKSGKAPVPFDRAAEREHRRKFNLLRKAKKGKQDGNSRRLRGIRCGLPARFDLVTVVGLLSEDRRGARTESADR